VTNHLRLTLSQSKQLFENLEPRVFDIGIPDFVWVVLNKARWVIAVESNVNDKLDERLIKANFPTNGSVTE
jgi:hypothetical protein